ncbi:SAM-dependent methyltransferase [Aurantimonas coralicida]|uniref:SAM-dependent methyltransferase n=1 Tax=Aurantimonas coralicida TaxID=182270 RepID=UPI001E4DBACD|nr:SAM-dependent methyltransferase [Aurantimonas coralicida]MCD1642971.1 SAM-dependent methyltransferase [Aurantimonas coralicida]
MQISAYLGALRRRSDPYVDDTSLEFQFRARRFVRIRNLIDAVLAEQERCEIVDLGGTEKYWAVAGDYLDRRRGRVFVTLVNTEPQVVARPDQFRAVRESASDLTLFEDQGFDLAHSNSVIEHVGSRANMRDFALNMRRLAPRYYCQTPNYWFPYEPHFRTAGFQYLPKAVRVAMLQRFALGFFDRIDDAEDARNVVRDHDLIGRRQMAAFFPDGEISYETVLGLRKSVIATRDAGARDA